MDPPDIETATDGYARRFAGPIGEWFLQVQGTTTLALLSSLPSGSRVLDVGGGHAQLTPYLIRAGFEVTVVGSAPGCARRLRPWLSGGTCAFEQADLTALPFRARAFDAVLAFRLMAHVESPERLIRELCRVGDQTVIVDYASTRSLNLFARAAFGAKRRIEVDTRPFRTCSPANIRAWFAEAGFSISAARPQFLAPMALHRRVSWIGLSRFGEGISRAVGLTSRFGSPVIVRADRAVSEPERRRGAESARGVSPDSG
jgi:2-polyprenyl-3-methyl-5-hydroxy-6-metoxy-1,4-benzoquinol methylase